MTDLDEPFYRSPVSNFKDVRSFYRKFKLPVPANPVLPDLDTAEFRIGRLCEELQEFTEAVEANDLAGCADALVDLVYIAMGTAVSMGLPWEEIWAEVHRANMMKVRATHPEDSRLGSDQDVVKPEGWREPNHTAALIPRCPRCDNKGYTLTDTGCNYCDEPARI